VPDLRESRDWNHRASDGDHRADRGAFAVWQSGITATCMKMKPIDAVFSICCSASASTVSGGRNRIALSCSRYL
jgi:hypothetical protein